MPTVNDLATPIAAMASGPEPGGSAMTAPVSVVIPCYRNAGTIAHAVASVAAQTLRPAEVLLVDDGSGDRTPEVLHRLAADYASDWIRVFALPENRGPSHARNVAWRHASQEFVAFLDADDVWYPQKIELQLAALRADPRIALIGHAMEVKTRTSPAAVLRPPVRTRSVSRYRFLLHNPFQTPSVMLRRDLPFRFDERFRRVEDYLLWAQIKFSGHRCATLDQVLAAVHKPAYGVSGLSGDVAAMHRAGREATRELLRTNLLSVPEYWFARATGMLRRTRRNLLLHLRGYRPSTRKPARP